MRLVTVPRATGLCCLRFKPDALACLSTPITVSLSLAGAPGKVRRSARARRLLRSVQSLSVT